MTDRYKGYGGTNDDPNDKNKPEKPNEPGSSKPAKDPFDVYSELKNKTNEPQKDKELTGSRNNQPEKKAADQEKHEKGDDTIEELLAELDGLVGLPRVKAEIKQLLQFIHVQDLRRQKGISNIKPSLHSVFYGSPGTGKTTIARLYGKMLKAIGLLPKGHVVETDRAGLVGGYVGQTAVKTNEKIEEALGGVLFIDEAYSLSKGGDTHNDFGTESIEILVKRMEDFRDRLVVIVAGHSDPMEQFLISNEGLRSRFSTFIHFDDYSPQEMFDIFRRLCTRENYEPTEEALGHVFTSIDYNYAVRDKSFGNARFVRNLFEVVIKNQAQRIASTLPEPTPEDLRTILPGDVPFMTPSDVKPFSSNKDNQKEKEKQQ